RRRHGDSLQRRRRGARGFARRAAMTALWTSQAVAAATGGTCTGSWAATGVSIDSRSVKPGDLFIALKGPSFDGHDYVAAALKAGAAGALVHFIPAGGAKPDFDGSHDRLVMVK